MEEECLSWTASSSLGFPLGNQTLSSLSVLWEYRAGGHLGHIVNDEETRRLSATLRKEESGNSLALISCSQIGTLLAIPRIESKKYIQVSWQGP